MLNAYRGFESHSLRQYKAVGTAEYQLSNRNPKQILEGNEASKRATTPQTSTQFHCVRLKKVLALSYKNGKLPKLSHPFQICQRTFLNARFLIIGRKRNGNDQFCFETHQMDVRNFAWSHARGRSALHDEQSRACDQARLHKPEFTCESHYRILEATEEKINQSGFLKSYPINLSPSTAPESTGAVLGLFYFQQTKFKNLGENHVKQ